MRRMSLHPQTAGGPSDSAASMWLSSLVMSTWSASRGFQVTMKILKAPTQTVRSLMMKAARTRLESLRIRSSRGRCSIPVKLACRSHGAARWGFFAGEGPLVVEWSCRSCQVFLSGVPSLVVCRGPVEALSALAFRFTVPLSRRWLNVSLAVV